MNRALLGCSPYTGLKGNDFRTLLLWPAPHRKEFNFDSKTDSPWLRNDALEGRPHDL